MSDQSQFRLLRQRRFGPFFLTQFLGAFNDNLFKSALIILLAFRAAELSAADPDALVNLSAALFILPFFLFSASAGQLADKYEKSRLIRFVKLLEIGLMVGVALAFYSGSLPLLLALLFLMGVQSTLFGPVKYAILPQHLRPEELVGGNGLVEMGTFVAILLGTLVGGILIGLPDIGVGLVSAATILMALLGYLASRGIPLAPAAAQDLRIDWNPLTATWEIFQFTRRNRTVYLSILGISWFWFFGATYLAQLPGYTRETLGSNEQVVTLLLTLFSLGIGVGSLLCERLSDHKVELGLVPFGSIGLTLFSVDLFFAQPGVTAGGTLTGAAGFLAAPGSWRVLVDVVLIGTFGGFYVVPLYALVQQRSAPGHRSRIIAGNNILNALFMVLSAVLAIVLLGRGLSIPQLFLLTAIFNAVVAIYIYTLVPEFLVRFIVWLLIHSVYRVRKEDLDRLPETGPALLVCNHVSLVDPLVIAGCSRRPIRFVIHRRFFEIPVLRFVLRAARAIPIAQVLEDPKLVEQAFDEVGKALESGELICLFPEGQMTEDGELQPFRPGVERIIGRHPVPVIPMALRGLWGSYFSNRRGRPIRGLPRRLWFKVGLAVGAAQSPDAANSERLEQAVRDLRGDWK